MGNGRERGKVEVRRLAYFVEDGCEVLEDVQHVVETSLEHLNVAVGV